MFYDLSITWTQDLIELQRVLAFVADLGYSVVAINHIVNGKTASEIACPIPDPLPFVAPPGLRILRRCTLQLTDPAQNHRLKQLAGQYDLVTLRPTCEKTLQLAIQAPEADMVSLDLTTRFPFHFRPRMFTTAHQRGIPLEICYGTATDSLKRRNLIANATALIRATRGRGIMLSSEASRPLSCRAPFDVINLGAVWGLSPERSREAISRIAKSVVVAAQVRRCSYLGVVDVLDGRGERPGDRLTSNEASASVTVQVREEAEGLKLQRSAPINEAFVGVGTAHSSSTRADASFPLVEKEQRRPTKRARQKSK